MTLLEGLIVRLVLKQHEIRLAALSRRSFFRPLDAVLETADIDGLRLIRKRRAHGHEVVTVPDIDDVLIIELQRRDEALPERRQEMQRTAEEGDMAADGPSLRQIADGLVHDGLHDGERNIRFLRAIIHQCLDIRLGKDAAARSNRVDLLALSRQLIKAARIRIQE